MPTDKSKLDKGKPRGQSLDQKGHLPKQGKGNAWLLGIGIDSYHHFPPLHNAVKDVKDLAGLLQERYGFKPEHTVLLFNEQATRKNIIEVLDSLEAKVKTEDRLVFYFSGHGHLKKFGETEKGYWIPVDAQSDNTVEYIRNNTIRDYLETISSMHTLLLADSCFSGSLFVSRSADNNNLALDELENRRSRWAICSGRHDEEVYDGRPGQNSPFSQSLLYELRQNESSRYNVAKLADRVTKSTRANYQQLPIGSALYGVGHQGGEFVFHLQISEQDFWNQTLESNTIVAYNDYLQTYPNGKYSSEALVKIRRLEEEAEWQRAGRIDRIYAYQAFLRSFPDGEKAGYARERIEQLEKETGAQPLMEKNWWSRHWQRVAGAAALVVALVLVGSSGIFGSAGEETRAEREYGSIQLEGQTYRTVQLNGLTWLADNLNLEVDNSWCNGRNVANCEQYGRLYTWDAARLACRQIGWRLPTADEWEEMGVLFGGMGANATDNGRKAFADLTPGGASGMDILLGGQRFDDDTFEEPGDGGVYWSNTLNDSGSPKSYYFYGTDKEIFSTVGIDPEEEGYSCRCVK